MKAYPISDRVFALHADIESEDLFEGIWPIPDGVSLNSYIVKGEKIALIDLVRDWVEAPQVLEEELAGIGLSFKDVDYLVLNHLEPDHTGWLGEFKAAYPEVEILATAKGIELVKSFYKVTEGLRAVKSGDSLDLGAGMVLRFEETPNVHWPETMMTYEASTGTLFSCDAFGSYGSLGDRIFDDQFEPEEHDFFETEALRYYSNIVSSFSLFVKRALAKIASLQVRVVAPSHGIVWRRSPETIIERYRTYADYMEGPQAKEICVVWGSMYGFTKAGVDAVIAGIEAEGLPYSIHRVPNEDPSYILADAFKCAGIVIAMPTYEYKMFPPMASLLQLFERKHIWNRLALRIGSWGWVGGAKKDYEEMIAPLKWTSLESLEWPGAAGEETLAALYEQGRELARRVKAL